MAIQRRDGSMPREGTVPGLELRKRGVPRTRYRRPDRWQKYSGAEDPWWPYVAGPVVGLGLILFLTWLLHYKIIAREHFTAEYWEGVRRSLLGVVPVTVTEWEPTF